MSEAVRLGDILPEVMRDIEARMLDARLQSNCTEKSLILGSEMQIPAESIFPGSLRFVKTAGEINDCNSPYRLIGARFVGPQPP